LGRAVGSARFFRACPSSDVVFDLNDFEKCTIVASVNIAAARMASALQLCCPYGARVMIRVPLQMDAHMSIYALGRNEIDGPTDDLAVRIHLNDQEAGELSLKALVGEHLHNVISFAESPEELAREATRFRALGEYFIVAANKAEAAANDLAK